MQIADEISTIADTYTSIADDQIRDKILTLREQTLGDTPWCRLHDRDWLYQATALTVEAVRRTLGMRLYPVQIAGVVAISHGNIAEMQTGEGKTLVAGSSAMVSAMCGRGVHVATTNSYLAQRDFEQNLPAWKFAGMTAGFLQDQCNDQEAKSAYACDITYGTGYQFGFDYLRDQTTLRTMKERRLGADVLDRLRKDPRRWASPLRQRGLPMTIIDEADSVMVDEAMVPLVLATTDHSQHGKAAYEIANSVVQSLVKDVDYSVDLHTRRVELLMRPSKIQSLLPDDQHEQLIRPWGQYLENGLRAHHLFQRDEHYVVAGGEIQIVDQNTGRIFPDRTWRGGLHQAVEAKECVEIQSAQQSNARMTRQRFYGQYECVAGLTGTASESATELRKFYQLPIVKIPTHRPILRERLPMTLTADDEQRLQSIVCATRMIHKSGRP
ncbi:MAG: hypothetical protein AAFN70_04615, partial [Planctomycetota bacterium]